MPSPLSGNRGLAVDGRAVKLADVRDALAVLFCGLSGQWAEVLADDDIEPGLIPADTHDTMRLPSSCARFATEPENRGWYQVAVAHRAGHYVWSSFDLDIKAVLARLGVTHDDGMDLVTGADGSPMGNWASFFRMFRRIELAGAVFGAVEDARVDSRLRGLVPGFARSLGQVLADELTSRPPAESLGPRDQALEVLQRMSVGYSGTLLLDPAVSVVTRAITELLPVAVSASATITDTAAVAALIYSMIDELPILSTAAPAKTWVGPPPVMAGPVPLPDRFLGTFSPDVDVARLEGEDRVRVNVPPASFRDIVGLRFRGIDHGSSGLKSELLIFKPGRHVVDRHYVDHDHRPRARARARRAVGRWDPRAPAARALRAQRCLLPGTDTRRREGRRWDLPVPGVGRGPGEVPAELGDPPGGSAASR